jgi:flagellar biosynthesis anti-sigma factor FlgM
MKVTGQQPPRASELTSGKAREAEQKAERTRQGKEEAPAPVQNRTSLTMNKIKDAIRHTPDVRADRVAEVKERIERGTHRVDAERLAENLLRESLREDVEKP